MREQPFHSLRIIPHTFEKTTFRAIRIHQLKVKSDGAIILRLEIIKKALMTLILAVTIPHSVEAVAWGLVAMTLCEFVINFAASMRYTSLGVGRMMRSLLPTTLITAMMVAAVVAVGYAMSDFGVVVRLMAEIGVGVVVYLLLAIVFRLEAFGEIRTLVGKMISK